MSIQTYQFTIGMSYWTYNLQENYLYPLDTSPLWWEQHSLTLGSSIEIDPGYTVLIQSLDQGPLIYSTYFVTPNALLSLYGVKVDYFNPTNMKELDEAYLYATVTNLGQQSIVLKQTDYIMNVNTLGLF